MTTPRTCKHCEKPIPFPRCVVSRSDYCSESCQRKKKYQGNIAEARDRQQRREIERRHTAEAVARAAQQPEPKPCLPPGYRAPTLAAAESLGLSAAQSATTRTESLTGAAAAGCHPGPRRAEQCP